MAVHSHYRNVPSGSGDGDQSAQYGRKRGIMRKLGMGRSREKEDKG
jgi:ribosomal protein S14